MIRVARREETLSRLEKQVELFNSILEYIHKYNASSLPKEVADDIDRSLDLVSSLSVNLTALG